MTSSLVQNIIVWQILLLLQILAALPWLTTVGWISLKKEFGDFRGLAIRLGVILLAGAAIPVIIGNTGPESLANWGRLYGSILSFQLVADGFILAMFLLLKFASKAGAVALAAFRESIRQPMFVLLTIAGILLLIVSPFLPYFTFGEDLKMLKDLAYITIMFMAAFFGVLAASMSISEEIEGRTAITVMSKPISRRNFLIGKFLGILMACMVMTVILGWMMIWTVFFKQLFEPVLTGGGLPPDPLWVVYSVTNLPLQGTAADFIRGILLWGASLAETVPGLVITFCHVMVLLAIAVALATRLPMVVNAPVCVAIYFLGHLTPILTAISSGGYRLINFVAQVLDLILPGLDMFDMGTAVVRSAPLHQDEFAVYTMKVALYAVTYSTIALLFGLILFEDRDLA